MPTTKPKRNRFDNKKPTNIAERYMKEARVGMYEKELQEYSKRAQAYNKEKTEWALEMYKNGDVKAPKKTGRPTTFKPVLCDIALELLSDPELSHSERSIAAEMDIPWDSWTTWKSANPEFATALAQGKARQERAYAGLLNSGKHKYAQGLIFSMKNMHGWKDKVEQETTINISDKIKGHLDGATYVDWDIKQPKHTDVIDVEPVKSVKPPPKAIEEPKPEKSKSKDNKTTVRGIDLFDV